MSSPAAGSLRACLTTSSCTEMTHALIDGLRSRFSIPTNPDVLGFHEGLSDLVAVLHHFLYPDVLIAQIRSVGSRVENSKLLATIAGNFGLTTIGKDTVRIAVESPEKRFRYDASIEAHEMGNVLVSAVFEAFTTLFHRKTRRYMRLAGPQVEGFWSEDLTQILAEKAARLARQC